MFGEEPDLEFVGANDIADEKIVGAIVAGVIGFFGHGASFLEDHFMGFEEAGNLDGSFFAAARWARNDGCLRNIRGHGDADAAEELDAFGDRVHEFDLFAEMLIEEHMELIEGVADDLPVMLFVEIAQGHGVGEDLIEVFDALGAGLLIEGDRELGDGAVGLNFMGVLMQKRACAVEVTFR